MTCAPIILFTYNRPKHTQLTVDALQKNALSKQSDLHIYSDGPKGSVDIEQVGKVRKYIRTIKGFRKIRIIERTENIGLANSIIFGVAQIVSKYGECIVLEDDLIVSPYFLAYMNNALNLYKDEERVISIHGYSYPVADPLPETYFLVGADCWGWATWKRGWDLFEPGGEKLRTIIRRRRLENIFTMNGTSDYMKMLDDQIHGRIDSWAVRWLASAVVNNKLTLYPGKSLVRNIGFDGTGTHSDYSSTYNVKLTQQPIDVKRIKVKENKAVRNILIEFYRNTNKKSRVANLIPKIIGKLFFAEN